MVRYAILFLLLTAAFPAVAAPPPPPPQYVWDAARVLVSQTNADPVQLASLFADDVSVFQNGKNVAAGKAAWLKWRADSHPEGRVLGYSESFGGYSEGGGEVLVVDTFDTVDQSCRQGFLQTRARPPARRFISSVPTASSISCEFPAWAAFGWRRTPRTRGQHGGWGGIRTHGGLAPTAVFKTAALNHSATHPSERPVLGQVS